jgi:hypothetical protein
MKHRALQCVHRPGRWAVVVAEAAARWRRVVRHGNHPRGSILHPLAALVLALWACTIAAGAAPARPHNVILFVPDGLRALSVTPDSAPTMAAVRDQGVHFKNAHALFPTFTTANASALATGHHLGDTGDYSNTIYVGYPIASAAGSVTPTLSNNRVPRDLDQHFGGDYLHETTMLKAARAHGFSTAAIGKGEAVFLFDHTEPTGEQTILVDDATGSSTGIPLSADVQAALRAAGLPLVAPPRGENGREGDVQTPGTRVANVEQQHYFVAVATQVVLPLFKARHKPFVLVFWSRDPDGTQHFQGDSLQTLTPGVNGPTSVAAVKNADDNLQAIRRALVELDLAQTTDVVVAADHGFATIAKESTTSPAAQARYADTPAGLLPPGFLAIDLATALDLPLFDPDNTNARVAAGTHPKNNNGLIGSDPAKPDVVVAANGGSDLLYLPHKDRTLAARVIEALLHQDYVSGLFVDDDLGPVAGTLPLSAINLKGTAITPPPAIVVNFRTFSTGCAQPLLCTVEIADTRLQQGQGMHGSLSRADTLNFMAAIGPSFRRGYVDEAPVSNADVGKTLAYLLGLTMPSKGTLVGRVLTEALPHGRMPAVMARTLRSAPSATGLRTLLVYQQVGATRYVDIAGFPGRTVGLAPDTSASLRSSAPTR